MNPDNLWDYSVQVCLYFLKKMLDHPALSNIRVISSDTNITLERLLESEQTVIYVPFKTNSSNHLYIHADHVVDGQVLTGGIAIHYDHKEQVSHLVLMPLDLSEGTPLTAFNLSEFDSLDIEVPLYYDSFIELVNVIENSSE
jgi:hypothetical protein